MTADAGKRPNLSAGQAHLTEFAPDNSLYMNDLGGDGHAGASRRAGTRTTRI